MSLHFKEQPIQYIMLWVLLNPLINLIDQMCGLTKMLIAL